MSLETETESSSDERGAFGETVRVIIHALILAVIVRLFLFQPFNIPSGSMESTLLVGDYLFVSKYSYGYSKYSFPFAANICDRKRRDGRTRSLTRTEGGTGGTLSWFCDGRFFSDTPERGDVAVFRLPTDTSIDYIKRVIGLPGDRIQMRDGILYVNDNEIPKKRIDSFVESDVFGNPREIPRYEETLPNGVTYTVLDQRLSGPDNTDVYTVPEGHYFMMGDNRDNSTDSRFERDVGFVPIENFVGRAEILFFSANEEFRVWRFWEWPWTVRGSRFFNSVR